MKIRAEIISLDTNGETMQVKLQGSASTDAEWRPGLRLSIELPDKGSIRKAYHLGRIIHLTVEPGK
jgi:hypothetical protein